MKLELFKNTEGFGAFEMLLKGPNQSDNPTAEGPDVWEYMWSIRPLVVPGESCLDTGSI